MSITTLLKCGAAVFVIGAASLQTTAAAAQAQPGPFVSGLRYDKQQRLTGTISPDPDGAGPLKFRAVRNSYDPAGRLTKVERGTLETWQSEAVAPMGWSGFTVLEVVDNVYDLMGRKLRESLSGRDPAIGQMTLQTVAQTSYDLLGRVECSAVRMNPAAFGTLPASACTLGAQGSFGPDRITRTRYNLAGQVETIQTGVGTAARRDYVRNGYTAGGRLASLADANGNRTELRYDGHDREVRRVFPHPTLAGLVNEADYEEYAYDANSNRTSKRLRDGNLISYGYDNLDRLTLKNRPGSEPDISYGYDNLGRMSSASQPAGSLTFGHDALGRLVSEINSDSGTVRTVGYQYDLDGNRTRITHADGVFFGYEHDQLGQLRVIRDNQGAALVTLGHDDLGRRTTLTFANGVVTSYGYDGASRLSSLSHDFAGTAQDVTFGYAYNPASQIVSRTGSNDLYAYSAAAGTIDTAVDGLNRLTSHAGGAVGYDAKGNMTAQGARALGYDSENKLVSTAPGEYLRYDPIDRLLAVTDGTHSITYDTIGDQIADERYTWTAWRLRHVFGPRVDEPLVWYQGENAERRFVHADERGSTIAVSRNDGVVTAADVTTYDAFGARGPTSNGRLLYTGKMWLNGPRLYYSRARFYDPATMRFPQPDPAGYVDGPNGYIYGRNDPVNNTDPTGTRCVPQREGGTVCDPPGNEIGSFTIPAGPNNPGAIGPDQSGYHVYNAETSTPYSSEGLTESVTEAVIDNPTPGNDNPASATGVVNDAGISPFSGVLGDKVTSFVTTDSNGNTVVVNVTIPGQHVLNPGYVAQAIVPSQNSTSIVVVGEGNARIQQGPGAALGGAVFQRKIDADMRRGILNAVRSGRW